jgi:hypothetical protein
MARYSGQILSQAAQLAGVPASGAGGAVLGYMGCWTASATAGFRLRRVNLGVIAGASVPTSQQVDVGLYRQTVLPIGTGLAAAVLGVPTELWTLQTDPTAGVIATTATTIGTTNPTLGANPMAVWTFNTQSTLDLPFEFLEEYICNLGTANGFAFVNLTNTLPAAHKIRINLEIEV